MITNCLSCGVVYEESSLEEANSPDRCCVGCFNSMKPGNFSDERIEEIKSSNKMTRSERAYLLRTIPSFEESYYNREELQGMSDADLMTAAYSTWAAYVSCMY